MKSFKTFAFLAMLPLVIISLSSYLIDRSFNDFKPRIILNCVGIFTLIGFNYVYVFEKRQVKDNKTFNNISIASVSVFLSVFLFGLVVQLLFLNNLVMLPALFQGLFATLILLFEFGILNFYRNGKHKRFLNFNENPIIYLIIIIVLSIIETLIFSLFSSELFTFSSFLNFIITSFFIPALKINASVMLSLAVFTQIKFIQKNIFLILTSSVLFVFLLVFFYADENQESQKVFFRSITISLSSVIICATIIFFRNKFKEDIQKIIFLESSVAKKNAVYLDLKNQVNPHFLFNNLNTMISFIEIDPKKAIEFGHHLSNVYRYYLKNKDDDFISLSDELNFIEDYLEIYKAKFENDFSFEIKHKALNSQFIVTATLQEIIDNIFKHNILDQEKPIEIKISIEEDHLNVYNSINLQKNVVSNKTGLININERNKILTNHEIIVTETKSYFEIKIPIINLEN